MISEFTTQEINDFVSKYEREQKETGITKTEFALREGLEVENLRRWISYRKRKAEKSNLKTDDFIKVEEGRRNIISFTLNGNLLEFQEVETLKLFLSLILKDKGGCNLIRL